MTRQPLFRLGRKALSSLAEEGLFGFFERTRRHLRRRLPKRRLGDLRLSPGARSVGFVLPGTELSGGILVALRHAAFLQEAGQHVLVLSQAPGPKSVSVGGQTLRIVDAE